MTARPLEQSEFHWPQGLYEPVPFVYLAAGLWVSFRLEGPVAAIASAFLILAGLAILGLRWTWRRSDAARCTPEAAALCAAAQPAAGPATEHERFVANYGLVAAASHGDRQFQESLIPPLLARLEAIHAQQEQVLRNEDPALATAHLQEHRMLAARISTLRRGPGAGKLTRQALTECIVYAALVERMADGRQQAFLA